MIVGQISLDFKSTRYFDRPRNGARCLVIRVCPLGLRLETATYAEANDWHDARFIRDRSWGAMDDGKDCFVDDDTKIPDEEILGFAELPSLTVGAKS